MCCDDPPQKRNWRLYHLLDLITPITSRQVKWNFRKVTLRHHYYQAYLVLYNRSRKYLFDSVGEDAYGFIASGTWGPFVPALGAVGTVILYCLVLMIEMALLILFFALLAAQDEGLIAWDWNHVAAPLMAFVAVMLVVMVFAMVFNFVSPRTYREKMPVVDRLSPVGNFLAAVCYFCTPFVFSLKMKGDPVIRVGSYLTYMCLPIMGDMFYYLTSLIWRWPRRLRLQMEVGNNRPDPVIYRGIFFLGILHMFSGVAQWVLLGFKLDDRMDRSYYIVFIPLCFRTGFRIAEACLRSLMKYTIGVRSKIGVAFDTVGSFLTNGMLLTSLYFVAVRIERGKEKVRLAYALIPVYLTLAYILLFLLVTMIVLLICYCRRRNVEQRINRDWTPPQENEEEEPVKALGLSTTTDSGNGRVVQSKRRGWDDVDHLTQSSAAFPENLDANRHEQDYDDFVTDADEPVFDDEGSPRSSQEPYGSPREDEKRNYNTKDDKPYIRATPNGNDSPYEVRHRTVTTTRRVYDVPSEESSSMTEEDHARGSMTGSGSYGTDDYTEVTTYIDEETGESRSAPQDKPSAGSSSYTEETTYVDEETEYTGSDAQSRSTLGSGSYSYSVSDSQGSYSSSAGSSVAGDR